MSMNIIIKGRIHNETVFILYVKVYTTNPISIYPLKNKLNVSNSKLI
jgi:hypothetical protein